MGNSQRKVVNLIGVLAIIGSLIIMTTVAHGRNVKPGTIVKVIPGDALYLVTHAESLAGIPSQEIYQCLRFSKLRNTTMSSEQANNMKKSKLLVKNNAGKIFLVEGKQKRHITSPAAFEKQGFDMADVYPVSQELLDCIPDGKPVK